MILKTFRKNNWPTIDVTRRSVEETAASILKIIEIKKINENNFSIKKWSKKKILDNHNIDCDVVVSNVDEDEVKASLLAQGANPLLVSKNLAELKSIKVSSRNPDRLVLG